MGFLRKLGLKNKNPNKPGNRSGNSRGMTTVYQNGRSVGRTRGSAQEFMNRRNNAIAQRNAAPARPKTLNVV